MNPQVVIAVYRAHAGKDAEFRGLLVQHGRALRSEGLITSRPTLVLKGAEGAYLEIFEWVSAEAARTAHQRAPIARLWETMQKTADFLALSQLPESHRPFAHFEPLALEA